MRGGVRHEREVHAVEHAAIDQQLLAAAVLLGWRADDQERHVQLVDDVARARAAPSEAPAMRLCPQP